MRKIQTRLNVIQTEKALKKNGFLLMAMVVILGAGSACTSQPVLQPPIEEKASLPDDQTWLSPGKIQVTDLRPGDSVSQKIKIHNGNDRATTFLIYFRVPDYIENGFITAPAEARHWVVITEGPLVVASRETKEFQITLDLPDNSSTPKQWEFWIGVKEAKEGGLTTELCARWLVTMKDS